MRRRSEATIARTDATALATARGSGTKPTARLRSEQHVPPGAAASLILGRYRPHRRLGAGGFGTVWLARDERLDRDVAVKVLPPERVMSGRFEREARAAARLAHPGIVTLYEAAVDEHGAYLVSELVRGATLRELLLAGRLSDRDVLSIAMALCDALAHAHAQGVVHRDVKPSNILVPEQPATSAELAKLTDFGVAHVIGGDSLTRTGDVLGTAAYMAPEQAEGREVSSSADLYSLALVVYEALTGVNPVGAGNAAQRARRLGAYLPPLRRQRRDLPRELGRAVDLALRPLPRERGTLEELQSSVSLAAGEVADTPGVVAAPWRPTPSRTNGPQLDGHLPLEPAVQDQIEEHPAGAGGRLIARALSAAATAAVAAWLTGHVLSPAPIAPIAAALLAAALVAVSPRTGWLAVTAAGAAACVLQDRPGAALVLIVAALLPVVLLYRSPSRWPLAAGAPALAMIGLAGAWPALAGRATTAWRRAALGAAGWLWLTLAATYANADFYARQPPAVPPPSVWLPSLYETTHHVLVPLLSSGTVAAALVWAVAAAVLPLIRSQRSFKEDMICVTIWAATVPLATAALFGIAHGHSMLRPAQAVLGAVASACAALAPWVRNSRDARRMPDSADSWAPLA